MASLHMGGCYPITEAAIDEEVTRVSPGNFALAYLDDGAFSDVNDRLHSWVGVDSRPMRYGPSAKAVYGSRRQHSRPLDTPALHPVGVVVDGRCTHFCFSYAVSAQAAFEEECRNYHDFGENHRLDNERHPAPPAGESWKCPVHRYHQRQW
jgi:hypothetical protein